jgi:hypothetical protein
MLFFNIHNLARILLIFLCRERQRRQSEVFYPNDIGDLDICFF